MRSLLNGGTLSKGDLLPLPDLAVLLLSIPRCLPNMLELYIAKIRAIHQAESGYHECADVLGIFGPVTRELLSYPSYDWEQAARKRRIALIKSFNELVQDVDQTSRQIQVRLFLHL